VDIGQDWQDWHDDIEHLAPKDLGTECRTLEEGYGVVLMNEQHVSHIPGEWGYSKSPIDASRRKRKRTPYDINLTRLSSECSNDMDRSMIGMGKVTDVSIAHTSRRGFGTFRRQRPD